MDTRGHAYITPGASFAPACTPTATSKANFLATLIHGRFKCATYVEKPCISLALDLKLARLVIHSLAVKAVCSSFADGCPILYPLPSAFCVSLVKSIDFGFESALFRDKGILDALVPLSTGHSILIKQFVLRRRLHFTFA